MIARATNALLICQHSSPAGLGQALRARFTYANPLWERNRQLKLSNYKTPRYIKLVDQDSENYILPRGLISKLAITTLIDETVTCPVDLPDPTFTLKPYQVPAVEKITRRYQGVLSAPPGSGKTVAAIAALLQRKQRTLIMVHTRDLAVQWIQRLDEFAGIPAGLIDGTTYDERDITVALVQTLRDIEDPEFYQRWGMIIVDECHHIPARTIYELVNKFPGRFRLGLSATPDRIDGLSFMLNACMGPILYEVPKEELFEAGMLVKPSIVAVRTGTNGRYENYTEMITALCENVGRNALIIALVEDEASWHTTLVLTERIAHAEYLTNLFRELSPTITCACLTSRTPQKERDSILESMRSGKLTLTFATKVAEEGLDIERLARVFLTMPIRSKNKVQQMIGRSMRLHPEKTDAKIFDFIDDIGLAKSQWYSRKSEVYGGFRIAELRNL